MKEFFKENVEAMSFTFTFIILLNAILGYILDYDGVSNGTLLILAAIILVLWGVSYGLSFVNFTSVNAYHAVNLGSTLFVFYVITLISGFVAWRVSDILSSGAVFIVLYFMNANRKKQQMKRLAFEINKQLSDSN